MADAPFPVSPTARGVLSRRDFIRLSAAGLAAGAVAGLPAWARAEAPAARPNILYILADQWRASATGYAGDPNARTPHLDALAARSVRFDNAVSVCPVCTPYRAALMTGRFPTSTGMFVNDIPLPAGEQVLGSLFKSAGYDTAYIGKWHLDGRGRQAYIPPERRRGFDYWKAAECDHQYLHSHYYSGTSSERKHWAGYDAIAQTADAVRYIQGRGKSEKPFLMVLSFGPPHPPFNVLPPGKATPVGADLIQLRPNVPAAMQEAVRKQAAGYYAHIAALDACVGDLLAAVRTSGAEDRTIVVFTSDHGETMGAHGIAPGQKQCPWDESVRVPFLVAAPAAKPRAVKTPLNTPDILPTLLDLAGLPVPKAVEGESLAAYMRGEAEERDRAALIMSVAPFGGYAAGDAYRGIRTARHTYVRRHDALWMMFDNEADPHQLHNLDGTPAWAMLRQELEERLQAELKRIRDPFGLPRDYLKKWNVSLKGGA